MTPISDFNHRPEPRILGAKSVEQARNPEILDHTTRQGEQPVEVRVWEEHVVASDAVRSDPSGPEVKIRIGDTKGFDKVKRLEDE